MAEHRIAFIGAGGIANAHAYALSALPFYYEDAPKFVLAAVSSVRSESRENFADRFGFAEALSTDEPRISWSPARPLSLIGWPWWWTMI